jgi:hypothetical protein
VNLIAWLGAASMAFVVWFTWRAYTGPDVGVGQSRRASIIEAWTNIAIGFTLNYLANLVLLPLMTEGGHLSLMDNLWGGWVYTAISIARQFAIRRWFNSRRFADWLASLLA